MFAEHEKYKNYCKNYKKYFSELKKKNRINEELVKLEDEKNGLVKSLAQIEREHKDSYSSAVEKNRQELIRNTHKNYQDRLLVINNQINQIEKIENITDVSKSELEKQYSDLLALQQYKSKVEEEYAILATYLPKNLLDSEINNCGYQDFDDFRKAVNDVPGDLIINYSSKGETISGFVGIVGGFFKTIFPIIKFLAKPFPIWWLNIIYWICLLGFGGFLIDKALEGFFIAIEVIVIFLIVLLLFLFVGKPLVAFAYLKNRKRFYYAVYYHEEVINNVVEQEYQEAIKHSGANSQSQIAKLKADKEAIEREMASEIEKFTGIPDDELGKTLIESYKKNVLEINNRIQQLEETIMGKKDEIKKNKLAIEKYRNYLEEFKNNLKYVQVDLKDTKGALCESTYLVSESKEELIPITDIHHKGKPIVLLYNLDENVSNISDVTSQLKNFISTLIEGFFRTNSLASMDLSIVDIVSGAKDFMAPPFNTFMTVYDKISKVRELIIKIEDLTEKVAKSVDGNDIKEVNAKRCENSDPPFKYQIVNFIVPPEDSNSNSNILNDDIWRLMQGCERFGFLPIFFVKEEAWNDVKSKKNKTSILAQLEQRIDENNIYKIDIKKCTCIEAE